MNPPNQLKPQRKLYLDVARVVAIISISLNHAVNRSYENYTDQMAEFFSIPLASTVFKTVISIFSRIGVPLFLMITGVLILNKRMETKDDIKKFYKHNLLSLFITTEIWYVLMYWFIVLFKSADSVLETRGILGAILGMFETMLFQNQVTFGSMWYMPMILCLYTTLPFVIVVKDKLSGSRLSPVLFLPAAILFLFAMVLPALNSLLAVLGLPTYTSAIGEIYLFSYYYLYIIIGYLVGKGTLAKIKTWLIGLIAGLSFLLCCGYQFYVYSQPLDYLVAYSFPLIPVCAGALFELIRRCGEHFRRLERPITYLSRISFGIYFVHIVIMTCLVSLTNNFSIPRPLLLIILEVGSFVGSILVIMPLSKIKVLKKYLFLIK